jgi:nitroreductase
LKAGDPMPEQTRDLFEIMSTTRSMRRLKPDPVPDELIRKILEAGVAAPSGGNMQRWRFLVVKDPAVKTTVGAYYRRAWHEVVSPRYRSGEPAPGTSPERFKRMLDAAQYLADHIHEAPVWIIPCMGGGTGTRTSGSSIYPAVQNMLLAARALCLGATLTTLYLNFEKEVDAALGLPDDVHTYALLPIGYPLGRFGPVRRVALSEVTYADRWGRPYDA